MTVAIVFANGNSRDNRFPGGWGCFLVAIIVPIIIIDRIYCNFDY